MYKRKKTVPKKVKPNPRNRSKNSDIKLMKSYVSIANLEKDLKQALGSMEVYESAGTENVFKLSCMHSDDCSEDIFTWMMNLMEHNIADLYRACDWGWDAGSKQKEMLDPNARFLIAFDSKTSLPIAFSHFRFDMDEDICVIYCYEIHIDKSARKLGLGKHMLKVLEALGRRYKMRKVVLTVFNHNQSAYNFFVSQGYTLDESSPQNFSIKTFYSILSKLLTN